MRGKNEKVIIGTVFFSFLFTFIWTLKSEDVLSSGFICGSIIKIVSGPLMVQKDLRALAVVVDFQDRKLEDYTGEGITKISDLERILHKMESHWKWMSVGTETISWDIIRVTVPHDFTPDAYANLFEFREDIIRLAKEKVDVESYDFDGEGKIDNIFSIVSSGEKDNTNSDFEYIHGGATNHNGVRMFMDPQGSQSVKGEVYGNFNHELGHGHTVRDDLWGLPDLYGRNDTVDYLSLMSRSWFLPAVGFSAYDRYLMGWIEPKAITKTKKNVLLLPAEENLMAVKISVPDKNGHFKKFQKEYYLIEYRKKPKNGFGSLSEIPDYNGLAIYHIYEKSWKYANNGHPPLVYFEPAGGHSELPTPPSKEDFWFPGNEKSSGIFKARKYNTTDVIFMVKNIRWSGEGIAFDVIFD